jgi:hypothetical protein
MGGTPHVAGICGSKSPLPENTLIHLEITSPDEEITLRGTLINNSGVSHNWTDDLYYDPFICNEQVCTSWGIEFWWPSGLPEGIWQVLLTWDGGNYSTTLDVVVAKPELSVLDDRAKTDLRRAASLNPCHWVSTSANLSVVGRGFPPNIPVYVPVYEETEQWEYRFSHAETFISDQNGDFVGQLTGSIGSGKSYILIGVSDPGNPYAFGGQIFMDVVGNAIDCFIVP